MHDVENDGKHRLSSAKMREVPMDSLRFDRLTRSLAGARSRRGVLRGLAVALGLAAGRATLPPAGVEAGACIGIGCPCSGTVNCVDGTICCNGSCQTSGDCGGWCAPDGAACPGGCDNGAACSGCCNGFCAGYGGCTSLWYSEPGGACNLADFTSCPPGYTCCPLRGRHNQGVCADSCYYP
jgi:hypothetical protein